MNKLISYYSYNFRKKTYQKNKNRNIAYPLVQRTSRHTSLFFFWYKIKIIEELPEGYRSHNDVNRYYTLYMYIHVHTYMYIHNTCTYLHVYT